MSDKTKKNNHEVARAFLKRWARDHGQGAEQLAVLDARTGEVSLRSPAKANFAMGKYLYVPEVDGARDDRVENWFGHAEQALVEFLRFVDERGQRPISHPEWVRILFGAVGLAHRSRFEIDLLRRAVNTDPHLQAALAANHDEHHIHLRVMENLINRISRDVYRLAPGTLTIVTDCEADVLVCDRPAFIDGRGELRTLILPLGPKTMALVDSTNQGAPVRVFSQADHGVAATPMVLKLNGFTKARARRWVVGPDPEALETIRDEVVQAASQPEPTITLERVSDEERDLLWSFPKGADGIE